MTHCSDTRDALELLLLRDRMRTGNSEIICGPIGTYTPILASDGFDFAAAVQTIREIGDIDGMVAALLSPRPPALMVLNEPETIVPNPKLALPIRTS